MERLITKGSFDVRVSRLRDEMSSPRILRIWLSRFVVAAMAAFSGLGKMRRDPKSVALCRNSLAVDGQTGRNRITSRLPTNRELSQVARSSNLQKKLCF
jgi:hypothetical protein